jgi:hypothetical protein
MLIDILDAHGARGFGSGNASQFSEADRWSASRTLFGCMPARVVSLRPGRDKYVPVVHDYLSGLGLPCDDRACLVLKGICEQLTLTSPALCAQWGLKPRRKYGVSHVRALGQYSHITKRQHHRCATCGVPLAVAENVELDHIIPFSIIGDVSDGSNWRLLCGKCNMGKADFLSSWLAPDSWNWISLKNVQFVQNGPTLRARYAVLATRMRCQVAGCGKGPEVAHLSVCRLDPRGLHIPSNLAVCCESHVSPA